MCGGAGLFEIAAESEDGIPPTTCSGRVAGSIPASRFMGSPLEVWHPRGLQTANCPVAGKSPRTTCQLISIFFSLVIAKPPADARAGQYAEQSESIPYRAETTLADTSGKVLSWNSRQI